MGVAVGAAKWHFLEAQLRLSEHHHSHIGMCSHRHWQDWDVSHVLFRLSIDNSRWQIHANCMISMHPTFDNHMKSFIYLFSNAAFDCPDYPSHPSHGHQPGGSSQEGGCIVGCLVLCGGVCLAPDVGHRIHQWGPNSWWRWWGCDEQNVFPHQQSLGKESCVHRMIWMMLMVKWACTKVAIPWLRARRALWSHVELIWKVPIVSQAKWFPWIMGGFSHVRSLYKSCVGLCDNKRTHTFVL